MHHRNPLLNTLRIASELTSYSCIKSDHHLEAIGAVKKLDGQQVHLRFLTAPIASS